MPYLARINKYLGKFLNSKENTYLCAVIKGKRGRLSPLFIVSTMEALKENIEKLITPKLEEMNLFLVDVVIGANYKIQVFADGIPSITIKQCTELSRFLESYLDEESSVPEKYTLEVSSPGMTNPLRVPQQYKKRIGSTLKITLNNGDQVAMILKEVDDKTLYGLRTKIEEKKTKKPVKKIKEEDLESIAVDLGDIKQALLHFNF